MFSMFKKASDTVFDYLSDDEKQTANDTNINRVQESLDQMIKYDEENREMAKEWRLNYSEEIVNGRRFIRIGDVDFCVEYVSDISVSEVGSPPCNDSYFSSLGGGVIVSIKAATNSKITVTLISGRSIDFECNRHCTEIMLQTIRDAIAGEKDAG